MCISLISMNTFHFLKLLDKVFPNTSVQYTIFLFRLRDVKYLKIGSALERLLFCNPTKWIQIETEKNHIVTLSSTTAVLYIPKCDMAM